MSQLAEVRELEAELRASVAEISKQLEEEDAEGQTLEEEFKLLHKRLLLTTHQLEQERKERQALERFKSEASGAKAGESQTLLHTIAQQDREIVGLRDEMRSMEEWLSAAVAECTRVAAEMKFVSEKLMAESQRADDLQERQSFVDEALDTERTDAEQANERAAVAERRAEEAEANASRLAADLESCAAEFEAESKRLHSKIETAQDVVSRVIASGRRQVKMLEQLGDEGTVPPANVGSAIPSGGGMDGDSVDRVSQSSDELEGDIEMVPLQNAPLEARRLEEILRTVGQRTEAALHVVMNNARDALSVVDTQNDLAENDLRRMAQQHREEVSVLNARIAVLETQLTEARTSPARQSKSAVRVDEDEKASVVGNDSIGRRMEIMQQEVADRPLHRENAKLKLMCAEVEKRYSELYPKYRALKKEVRHHRAVQADYEQGLQELQHAKETVAQLATENNNLRRFVQRTHSDPVPPQEHASVTNTPQPAAPTRPSVDPMQRTTPSPAAQPVAPSAFQQWRHESVSSKFVPVPKSSAPTYAPSSRHPSELLEGNHSGRSTPVPYAGKLSVV